MLAIHVDGVEHPSTKVEPHIEAPKINSKQNAWVHKSHFSIFNGTAMQSPVKAPFGGLYGLMLLLWRLDCVEGL